MDSHGLMEGESESLDISSLKYAVLQPRQFDSEESQFLQHRQPDVTAATYAKFSQSQPATRVAASSLPDTVPGLAGTVPDSQQLLPFDVGPEDRLGSLPPAVALSKAVSAIQKMNSQGSDAATQELSPSHFESILNTRSRSVVQYHGPTQDGDEEEEGNGETQMTLHEGDEGHIDIVSSLVSPLARGQAKDLDSDPVDFSPSQSQRALSQFPESQRFKTPATAGKKRRHNGETVDSPALPRNPLLLRGSADDNDAAVMGLSQAFAATQANTSPFVGNGALPELPSDRPSPKIQLQPRPVTAASSSPNMRPISTPFQRASTEPAARYVSSKESQAERGERQAKIRQQELVMNGEESDDGFDDEPSSMTRYRRERQIEQRIRATFQRLSSPRPRSARGASVPKSSPIRSRTHRSSDVKLSKAKRTEVDGDSNSSSPAPSSPVRPGGESEEETEQEDDSQIAVRRSSQVRGSLPDEDKENCSQGGSQIPETAARLLRVMTELPAQVQDSPLLRRERGPNVTADRSTVPLSSGLFAVADSQPSQPHGQQHLPATRAPKSTDGEGGVERVPQSPSGSPQPTEVPSKDGSEQQRTGGKPTDSASHDVDDADAGTDQAPSSRQQPRSTIPETSSNEQGQTSRSTGKTGEKEQSSDSRGQFETAQSRLPPSSAGTGQENALQLSSPPIATTPPGYRRRRLAEIAGEPSPLKSQVSFNASDALKIDQNFLSPLQKSPMMDLTAVEVIPMPPSPSRGVDVDQSANEQPQTAEDRPKPYEDDINNTHANTSDSEDEAPRPGGRVEKPVSSSLRRERKPSAKLVATLESHSKTPRTVSTSRRATWDLDASPPQTSVPVVKSSKLKRKADPCEDPQSATKRSLTKRLKSVKDKLSPRTAVVSETHHEQPQTYPQERPVSAAAASGEQGHDPAHPVAPPAATTESIVAPNMVFAAFNGKTIAYYPALCLGPANAEHTRFRIQWEGYDPDEIDEHGIRALDLQIGDQVKVNMDGFPKVSYVVRGFKDKVSEVDDQAPPEMTITDRQGHKTLLVAPKQRKSLPTNMSTDAVKEVPVSAIYLASNMWGQMRDRVYKYKDSAEVVGVGPTLSSSAISTPRERRSSTLTTPSSRNRRNVAVVIPSMPTGTSGLGGAAAPPQQPLVGVQRDGIFANMAFAISYEDQARKSSLVDLIQANGGVILDQSFLDLLEPDSIDLKPQFADLSFTALLTERHSRKEKYMQALALGLPCLSGKWVEACMRANRPMDWTTYLLPAGESAELDGAVKSRILNAAVAATVNNNNNAANDDVATTTVKVKDMILARPNILAGSRVIVVMGTGSGNGNGNNSAALRGKKSAKGNGGRFTKANVKGKKAAEARTAQARRKPYLFLIRALGAATIQTEPDLVSAKTRLVEEQGSTSKAKTNANAKPTDNSKIQSRSSRTYTAAAGKNDANDHDGDGVTAGGDGDKDGQVGFDATKTTTTSTTTAAAATTAPGVTNTWVFVDDADVTAARTMFAGLGHDGNGNVKVLCNEDLVQTLILGKLWIG
ncbi:hypothetical protein ABEF95_000346 [Exophiala dermatitidis]